MRLVSNDGILKQEFHKDDITGKSIVKTTQDVSAVIDSNKYQQQYAKDFNPSKPFHRVASIPLVVVHELMKKGIWKDISALRAFLDSSENKFLRTDRGNRKLGKVKKIHYV